MLRRIKKKHWSVFVLLWALPLILGSSAPDPEPELDDHGNPIATGTQSEGEHHEEEVPPFTFFVRGIEPDFKDVVVKAVLAPLEEEAEWFPTEFSVRWITPNGRAIQIPLTPVEDENFLAAKIRGPLERGIHTIQATLVMRDRDGFVARVAEQHAELESQTLRLQAGPLKLFPEEMDSHHGEETEPTGFNFGSLLPFLGLGVPILIVLGLVFFMRKKGVEVGQILGKLQALKAPLSKISAPLTKNIVSKLAPVLTKLKALAPARIRRILPTGEKEERLERGDMEAEISAETEKPSETGTSAPEEASTEAVDEASEKAPVEDQPTMITPGESDGPEEEGESPDATSAEAADEDPSDEQPDAKADGRADEPEVKKEDEEESKEEPAEIEAAASGEQPEAEPDGEPTQAGMDEESPPDEEVGLLEDEAVGILEDEHAETQEEEVVGILEDENAVPEAPGDADGSPKAEVPPEDMADAQENKDAEETPEESEAPKGELEIEIPSEVDPDKEQTGAVDALEGVVDDAEADAEGESGEPTAASVEAGESETKLEIEGLLESEPPSNEDPE